MKACTHKHTYTNTNTNTNTYMHRNIHEHSQRKTSLLSRDHSPEGDEHLFRPHHFFPYLTKLETNFFKIHPNG